MEEVYFIGLWYKSVGANQLIKTAIRECVEYSTVFTGGITLTQHAFKPSTYK